MTQQPYSPGGGYGGGGNGGDGPYRGYANNNYPDYSSHPTQPYQPYPTGGYYDSYQGPPTGNSPYYQDKTEEYGGRHADYDDFRDEGRGPTGADDGGYIKKTSVPFHARIGSTSGSPTLSEAKLLVDPELLHKPIKKKRNCCYYAFCMCWPRWARWICWSCLFILVAIIVAIVVIAVTFKMPQVNFNGLGTQNNVPEVSQNGTSFSFNFALEIGVVNDNFIGATFEEIKASAFYPINNTPVGGGQLFNVNFPAHSTTNVTFPFNITYNPALDKDQTILSDIANKCGFEGNPKTPIKVNYTLTLYLRLFFFTIAPSIAQSTSIDCPIQNGQLPAFAQNAIPTSLVGGLPTATPTP